MGTLMPSSVGRQSHVVVTRGRHLFRSVARTSGRSDDGGVLIGRSVRRALYCILALIRDRGITFGEAEQALGADSPVSRLYS